jgi:methylamine---glutamate N-methyltransferase subunit C
MPEVPNTATNKERCLCADCPSYPDDGGFFCAAGSSELEIDRQGCRCSECENFKEFGLSLGYYCADGSAAEIE